MGTFVPPARGSAPGVRSVRSPERQDSHDEVTTWFVRWCDARCISVRDLAEILGTSAPLASRKRRGETPITLVDIRKFPARYRHTLIAEFTAFVCSLDSFAA